MAGTVSFGTLLLITKDAVDYLEFNHLLNADGSFNDPNIAQDTMFIAAVIQSAAKHGIVLPADVQRVVKALPAILIALGVEESDKGGPTIL